VNLKCLTPPNAPLVAVLDTGFDARDVKRAEFRFNNKYIVREWDCFNAGCPKTGWTGTNDPSLHLDLTGHGTKVTSMIAALNNTKMQSGILNGVFDSSQTPLEVDVFQVGDIDGDVDWALVMGAIEQAVRNNVRVINMSFGSTAEAVLSKDRKDLAKNLNTIVRKAGHVLFVTSAGNQGADAVDHFPSALSRSNRNVISVGGIAVNNMDGTGELMGRRALFAGKRTAELPPNLNPIRRCDVGPLGLPLSRPLGSSNCGRGITMVAPAEDVFVFNDPNPVNGTSYSAPIVAGMAGLMLAIAPQLKPAQVCELLIRHGANVADEWNKNTALKVTTPKGKPFLPRLDANNVLLHTLAIKAGRETAPTGMGCTVAR
jgi:subtilisin family serine protease